MIIIMKSDLVSPKTCYLLNKIGPKLMIQLPFVICINRLHSNHVTIYQSNMFVLNIFFLFALIFDVSSVHHLNNTHKTNRIVVAIISNVFVSIYMDLYVFNILGCMLSNTEKNSTKIYNSMKSIHIKSKNNWTAYCF